MDCMRDPEWPSLVLQAVCLLQAPRAGGNTAGMLLPAPVQGQQGHCRAAKGHKGGSETGCRKDLEQWCSSSNGTCRELCGSVVLVPQMFS